jgi:hypothetical protein
VNLFCLSHCPNREAHAEEDRCGQKPRRFLEECQRFERVNDTSVGISANRAVTVKIKTHDFLAIHTPESYRHLFVSVLQTVAFGSLALNRLPTLSRNWR